MKYIEKHIARTLSLLLVVFVLTSCASVRFNVDPNPLSYNKIVEESQDFYIGGLWQREGFNAAKRCGGAERVVAVEYKFTASDIVLSVVTFGLYAPRTAVAFCK